MSLDLITKQCKSCISEGEDFLNQRWFNRNSNMHPSVDFEQFNRWLHNCRVLISNLGSHGKIWRSAFYDEVKDTHHVKVINSLNIHSAMLGTLKSIESALSDGYLVDLKDLIFAEAFANLLEQAEYLLNQNYYLAAGVLGRAVLEEKLRNLCNDVEEITIEKERPTLNVFKSELYKAQVIDKVQMKHLEYLISIGNNAAHNSPDLSKEDVSKLLNGVNDFLVKF